MSFCFSFNGNQSSISKSRHLSWFNNLKLEKNEQKIDRYQELITPYVNENHSY